MSQTKGRASEQAIAPAPQTCDPVWSTTRKEAEQIVASEPVLAGFVYSNILSHNSLEEAICYRIAQRLHHGDVGAGQLREIFTEVLATGVIAGTVFRADIAAVFDRDPACQRYLEPLLYYKGFHALATHRFAHALWQDGREDLALYLQSQSSRIFGVDINPACRIGKGIMLDHGTGIVVGETASIGDNCSILQGVTLGGTGKESDDRHPKIGRNVLIGAGAHVLGNISVGDCSLIAAGSVVLKAVPAKTTVAGVPAKVVGPANCSEPARSMDQRLAPDDCGGAR